MNDEMWIQRQIEIQNRSFYLRSRFNAFLFSIVGASLVLVKIMLIDTKDPIGLIFVGLGVLSIAIGITGYVQGHRLIYPDKWYYLAPKIVMKKMTTKVVGLF